MSILILIVRIFKKKNNQINGQKNIIFKIYWLNNIVDKTNVFFNSQYDNYFNLLQLPNYELKVI